MIPFGGSFQQDALQYILRPPLIWFLKKCFPPLNVSTISSQECSPDQNPIENVWGIMKQKIALMHIENSDQLYVELVEHWHSLMSNDHLRYNLINSMHCRITSVIVINGFPIKYLFNNVNKINKNSFIMFLFVIKITNSAKRHIVYALPK